MEAFDICPKEFTKPAGGLSVFQTHLGQRYLLQRPCGSGMGIQCGVATQVSSIEKKWGSPTRMVYHGVSIKI